MTGAQPPLDSAVAHLARGDTQAALCAASDACRAAPECPEPHYIYGQAWLAASEPARAEQAFAAAIERKPEWADAWINYGIARYRQGAVEDAKTAMRQALLAAPDHPAASANLGAFLRVTGESQAADDLLRRTLARAPQNAGARINLAADLLQEERAAEALALFDEAALPTDLQTALQWHLQRALALLQLRRAREARAALAVIEELGPLPPRLLPLLRWRHVLLAILEGDPARAAREAGRMERALDRMGPDAVSEHRIMGHYDLAKFWSGQGDNRRAFAHWTAGHRLLAASQPFSRAAHAAGLDATRAAFDRKRFDGPRASNRDPAPVFIVGMPRSGTTLVEQILAAHRDVHGAGERSALANAVAALGGRDGPDAMRRIAGLDEPALDKAAADYLDALHALAPDKARIVDKMPGNCLYLGLVGLMLPGARIIHCTRDPRDIGLSIFTFRFHSSHGYAHDLGDLGWTIAQQSRLMAHWKAVLPNPILTVRLADWVEDFDGTLRGVLNHLDLPPDPNCARFYEADNRVRTVSRSQVRQPVNARGLGRWPPFAQDLAPLIEALKEAGELPAEPEAPAPDPAGATLEAGLECFTPADRMATLGMAVRFLMQKVPFTTLPFGEWSEVLVGQVERGDCFFVVDAAKRIRGFVGWFSTTYETAEAWVADATAVQPATDAAGDCVIFNVWAAESRAVHRVLLDEVRRLHADKRTVYFKRYYPDGRIRPVRFAATEFVLSHVSRAQARGDALRCDSDTPHLDAPSLSAVA